jgi:peptidoglycan/LPS O-acetylase OafA/YrhL
LIVVLHHTVLACLPSLIGSSGTADAPRWTVAWWFSETPFHIWWSGHEMVLVFFVLSGYVV